MFNAVAEADAGSSVDELAVGLESEFLSAELTRLFIQLLLNFFLNFFAFLRLLSQLRCTVLHLAPPSCTRLLREAQLRALLLLPDLHSHTQTCLLQCLHCSCW